MSADSSESSAKRMSFTLEDGSVISFDGQLTATGTDGVFDVFMEADTVTLPTKMLRETAKRIAELERHNELLRAVANALDDYFSADINDNDLIDELQDELLGRMDAAIEGGALTEGE